MNSEDSRTGLSKEFVQRHQDELSRTLKVAVGFINAQGLKTVPSQRDEAEVYTEFNEKLAKYAERQKTILIERLPGSDESVAAVPILANESSLGCWIFCGFRILAAGEIAESKDSAVPVFSNVEFDIIMQVIELTNNHFVELIYSNRDLKESLIKQQETSDTFRAFIDTIDAGVYVMDYLTGDLIVYNKYYEEMNKSASSIGNKKCFEVIGNDTFCPFCPKDKVVNAETGELSTLVWENYLEPFGQWLRITNRGIRWINGRLAMMITYIDITERKNREKEMEYLAYFDQMLDIPNRVKLFQDIEQFAAPDTYLVVYDIQGLRKVNDVYGRETGDGLLHAVSTWVQQLIQENMTLYRIDGDSFAVMIRNTTNEDAQIIVEAIFRRFADSWSVYLDRIEQKVLTNVSIGIIPCSIPFDTSSFMLNIIERVISAAQTTKKPLVYDENTNRAYQDHMMLEMSLKNSVFNNMEGFSLVFQPIVDPNDGKWVGVEALCRWVSPELGPISPIIFIAEAEQLGLIDLLGEWVLQQAMSSVKDNGLCGDDFILDVNLSPLQLNNRDFYHQLRTIIDKIEYPTKCLSVEITESADIHFSDHMLEMLYDIQSLGLSMALDDFGTGYASFSKVSSLPVNTLKIDRSFVVDIETVPFYRKTMSIMIDYAHAAGIKVIVEGVENQEQRDILVECGADFIQGFFYAYPMTMEEIIEKKDMFR